MIKVLIADDHKLVREGLRSLLTLMASDIEVIGEAASGEEVLSLLQRKGTDLVLMDIDMPEGNGIETTRQFKRLFPEVKVLMLTMADKEQNVRESLEAGAQGYLLKTSGQKELLQAIRVVAGGEEYFSTDLTKMLLSNQVCSPPTIIVEKQAAHLSKKELKVLDLIAQGYTSRQMASILYVTKRTIESHRQSLLEKTGSSNTATLIRYAFAHELLT